MFINGTLSHSVISYQTKTL